MSRRPLSRAIIPFAALVLSGCMTAYEHNSEFQAWLQRMDAKCHYKTIFFYSPEDEEEFLNLAYQGFYDVITADEFANRMIIKHPGHRLAIDCMASSFPRSVTVPHSP